MSDTLENALARAAQIMAGTVTYVGHERQLARALIELSQQRAPVSEKEASDPVAAELVADSERDGMPETGIFVRAKLNGRFESVDVAMLTGSSLLAWMRSRGGRNVWAENFALHLLGHAQVADKQ